MSAKKYSLSPSGTVLLIVVILLGGMFIYFYNQPKQVEYIYKQVTQFFQPSEITVPELNR